MRRHQPLFALAAAASMLVACGGWPLPTSSLPGSNMHSDVSRPALFAHGRNIRPDSISSKELFVGYFGYSPPTDDVVIFQNGTFKQVSKIGNGINVPIGSWVDKHGLYVANYDGGDVTEYSSPKASPFIYSKEMQSPYSVTTDAHGNVYEGDESGQVNEYGQRSNTVETRCRPGGIVTGVAVDASGDVFVGYGGISYGYIEEYTNFASCAGTALPISMYHAPSGMVLDKNGNLLVCDIGLAAVDIIKPPYNSVSGHLAYSLLKDPVDITINSANNRVWVVDQGTGAGVVFDLFYPSGKRLATIKYNSLPYSAVDGSNYVP